MLLDFQGMQKLYMLLHKIYALELSNIEIEEVHINTAIKIYQKSKSFLIA